MNLEIQNGRQRRNSLTVTIYAGGNLQGYKVVSIPPKYVLEIQFGGTVGTPAVEVHSGTITVWGWAGGTLLAAKIRKLEEK